MDTKLLRGQVRIAVKEILPEILKEELLSALQKRLDAKLESRLQSIAENFKQTLDKIDERAKDVHNYMVRQATPFGPVTPPASAAPASDTDSAQQ